jgi:hypothetical protein
MTNSVIKYKLGPYQSYNHITCTLVQQRFPTFHDAPPHMHFSLGKPQKGEAQSNGGVQSAAGEFVDDTTVAGALLRPLQTFQLKADRREDGDAKAAPPSLQLRFI